MNKERLADMLNQNQELEIQFAALREEKEKNSSHNTSFEFSKG